MVRVGFLFLLILISHPPAVHPVLSVAGDWDGQFDGTIVERSDGGRVGESQTDIILFSLRQSGSAVTGELVFGAGWPYELRAPLTSTLAGKRFNYRAELQVDDCLLVVEAETTLNPMANKFSGGQTQSNCEGRAVGRITFRQKAKGVSSPLSHPI